eukprot:scaffold31591_cov17-Tisochrysis_lutea.AAC.2
MDRKRLAMRIKNWCKSKAGSGLLFKHWNWQLLCKPKVVQGIDRKRLTALVKTTCSTARRHFIPDYLIDSKIKLHTCAA